MELDQLKALSFELVRIDDILQEKLGLEPLSLRSERFQQEHDRLQARWYASYDPLGDPRVQPYDYGIYADPVYPHLMLDCFRGWTRITTMNAIRFVRDLRAQRLLKQDLTTILDVFAGTGQASILLAKAFPTSTVFYHNTDAAQVSVMKALMKRYDVKNVKVVSKPRPAELVFAMEAIEHVLDPMGFLAPILKPDVCKFYIDGSSFGIDSPGHFKTYMHGDLRVPNTEYKRFFFKQLRDLGYFSSFDSKRFVYPRFYNGRPNVFVRDGAVRMPRR